MTRPAIPIALIMTAFYVAACAAHAAERTTTTAGNALGGSAEVILVAQIALLLLIGRGLGEIMQKIRQPSVVGQLLAGLVLGPSLFGWLFPAAHQLVFPDSAMQKSLIAGISNIGVMMLLLLTGMETDLKLVGKVGVPAFMVSAAGVAVPFLCGFALGWYIPDSLLPDPHRRLIAALFLGTALSISSIKIVAMIVREMNFMRRNLGQIIVASAIMEDTAGWVIISLTLGLASAGGFSAGDLARPVIGTAIFLVLSYTIGRRLVYRLIRWVNDNFTSEYAVVTAILIVMCVLALITQAIGVNTVLGAFVAGVLVGGSPILSRHIEDQLRGLITAFMMPIFFGLSGLSADLTVLKDPHLALLTLAIVAVASVGKFGGAFLGGRISGLSGRESLALGCAMNARGSTEVIVASIGLSMGVLTHNLYTMILTMAVITTMAMPPMLRWALAQLPMSEEERARIEKEDLDERGFVSRFERLLIAADDGANGRLATRFAGFIAGQRGLPITVLHVPERPGKALGAAAESSTADLEAVAAAGAADGHRAAVDQRGESRPEKVDVLARVETERVDRAVAKESRKGYDLLFVGVEKMRNTDGSFSANVDRAAAGFDGPTALTIAGRSGDALAVEGLNILVPVNGTEPSRAGAEIAFAISPAGAKRFTALHVAQRTDVTNGGRRNRARRRTERALLKDVLALAKRYGHENIRTAVQTKETPDTAILNEARRIGADLIVIGAARRMGESLYLGQTVASVLAQWQGAIVLLAT
ncbi:MAG TPA: cation:proton antiporter [Rhizomicrobium sp.]|jgi:Kef-type K+ transport system membrane component KefB/nucleotide-binding universal stress UspA family protein|nr:cation:proton antiporter [Rhizomicrobium sp.]